MTAQPTSDEWQYVYVGDLKPGEIVRTHGFIKKVEKGSMTNTIHFENEGVTKLKTWHQFHSVEVKKES